METIVNIKIKYRVDLIKKNKYQCDAFICGIDDFEPKEFDTKEECYSYISRQSFGEYTITAIYYI